MGVPGLPSRRGAARSSNGTVVMGIVGVLWAWLTYSLAFGVDWGGRGIIGTFHFAGLLHIDTQPVPGYAGKPWVETYESPSPLTACVPLP